MKYLVSVLILLTSTSSYPLFYCFKKVTDKHHKIKEPHDDAFLQDGINKIQPITLHLKNSETHPERMLTRGIPHYLFKKSAEWQFEIVDDRNDCIDIKDLCIACPPDVQKNSLHLYTWELQPKQQGIAMIRLTYKAPYRKNNPYVQEFLVTVE